VDAHHYHAKGPTSRRSSLMGREVSRSALADERDFSVDRWGRLAGVV